MNGNPRDQISTDLYAGRPTISPVADALSLKVAALMSLAEAESLFSDLEERVRRSTAFTDWMNAPTRYLAEFDAEAAASIEGHLADLDLRMVHRARARGWEVDATT